MSEHHASNIIHAPVHQVYSLFTHFNDFPKFMRFVKEVTYYDDQRSHWVIQLAGTHEWDAVNEDWIPEQQIGWRSTHGLENTGRVKFQALAPERTRIDVYLTYTPPAGMLGELIDRLGLDEQFDQALQKDLDHFAQMVEDAPPGALDPMQSHYLFHTESAVTRGEVTPRQEQAMQQDPMMSQEAMQEREKNITQEQEKAKQQAEEAAEAENRRMEELQLARKQHQEELLRQAERDRQIAEERRQALQKLATHPELTPRTLGGRGAEFERTALGDQDARSERFPRYQQDPMIARTPSKGLKGERPSITEIEEESPWKMLIRGQHAIPESSEDTEEQQKSRDEQNKENT